MFLRWASLSDVGAEGREVVRKGQHLDRLEYTLPQSIVPVTGNTVHWRNEKISLSIILWFLLLLPISPDGMT